LYESLYKTEHPYRSVSVLGCPVVSAVACALAKTTGKTVFIREQKAMGRSGVNVMFGFIYR